MTALLDHLETSRAYGRKLLVPYLMGGVPDRVSVGPALEAIQEHADAVEVGVPYSDPLMDGPVIAAAAERALRAGVGPAAAMELAAAVPAGPPRALMTYYNPIHRVGEDSFCAQAAAAGFGGLIVPDVPHEEAVSIASAAGREGLAWIPLVAPTSSPERVKAIAATATGFIYAVSVLGVTGTREALAASAAEVVAACRAASALPVLVGIGVSTPEQAVAAAGTADGVVIGSAVVRAVVEEGAEAAGEFLARVRAALDDMGAGG